MVGDRPQHPGRHRRGIRMYIGLGTLLVIVVIVLLLRRR
jgi:hypothetical protein